MLISGLVFAGRVLHSLVATVLSGLLTKCGGSGVPSKEYFVCLLNKIV